LGTHQNLVYTTHEGVVVFNPNLPPPDTLKRYDVTTGQITDIVKLDTSISDAHISADGQWVLFATDPSSIHEQAAIQMIRMDGQGLQTLYCNPVKLDPTTSYLGLASIRSIAWSTDQKLVMFSEGDNSNNPPSLYLLNLAKGTVQKELQSNPGSSTSYYSHLWIDNTHVALLGMDEVNGSLDASIFIFDTNKGANQQSSNLQLIATDSTLFIFDFDISPDHTEFILGKSSNLSPFTSSISVLPVKGGSGHTIFTSQTLQVIDIRVISSTTLLVYLLDPSGTNATDQSGLYKMHMDGTGFTKLIGNDVRNGSVQPAAIGASRDRSMYALGLSVACGQHCSYSLLRFGSVSGDKPTTLPDSNRNPNLVGWTTM
jgi:dipeptidyl aminopeptidase/acylaminoacyl peptidase